MKHYNRPIDCVRVIKVIESTIMRRGSGIDASDPIRIVTQYWTLDGKLIFEIDPERKGSP